MHSMAHLTSPGTKKGTTAYKKERIFPTDSRRVSRGGGALGAEAPRTRGPRKKKRGKERRKKERKGKKGRKEKKERKKDKKRKGKSQWKWTIFEPPPPTPSSPLNGFRVFRHITGMMHHTCIDVVNPGECQEGIRLQHFKGRVGGWNILLAPSLKKSQIPILSWWFVMNFKWIYT